MLPGFARPRQRDQHAAGTSAPDIAMEQSATRGSRLPLVLGAATGILLCAVVLAVLFVVSSRATSPAATGQALCADLQAQNYDAIYNLLAPSLQGVGSATQFDASQRELDALSGKVMSCTVTVQQADSTQASLWLTIARQQTGTVRAAVRMQLLDGVWRV
ncbi:MAG TPA: hypothetical protein VKQ30_18950, partial [Ktedonobacterales bacterium]|nr:hypothetical protein [Ktedonobacterales bacterium]